MVVREVQVTFDCSEPEVLATFWREALGYREQPPPPGFVDWQTALAAWQVPDAERTSRSAILPPEGEPGPRLFFQRVPEGKTAKNRVHLDVRVAPGLQGEERMAALESESERLVAHGATRVRRVDPDGGLETGFVVLLDPEGNELCLD